MQSSLVWKQVVHVVSAIGNLHWHCRASHAEMHHGIVDELNDDGDVCTHDHFRRVFSFSSINIAIFHMCRVATGELGHQPVVGYYRHRQYLLCKQKRPKET